MLTRHITAENKLNAMYDPMEIIFGGVSLPTGAGTMPLQTKGSRKQQTVSTRTVRSTHVEKRLRTKKKLAQLLNNIPKIVRSNPMDFFVAHLQNVLEDWIIIRVKTTLPSGITSSDPSVISAFQLLDGTIDEGDNMRSRFADIQLLCIFTSLEDIIASERRNAQI